MNYCSHCGSTDTTHANTVSFTDENEYTTLEEFHCQQCGLSTWGVPCTSITNDSLINRLCRAIQLLEQGQQNACQSLQDMFTTAAPLQAELQQIIKELQKQSSATLSLHDMVKHLGNKNDETTITALPPSTITFYRDFGSPENKAANGKSDIFALLTGSWNKDDTAETIASLDGQIFIGGWYIGRADLDANCTILTASEAANFVPKPLWERLRPLPPALMK